MHVRDAQAAEGIAAGGACAYQPARRGGVRFNCSCVAQDEAEAEAFLRGQSQAARAGEIEHPRVGGEFGYDGREAPALEGLVHGPEHVFSARDVEVDEGRGVEARKLQAGQVWASGFGA